MASKRKLRKTIRPVAAPVQQRLLGIVHQVWLAGLGAASKATDEAPALFEELVAEGARVQAQNRGAADKAIKELIEAVNARVGEMRGQVTDTLNGLEKVFQTRVHRALTQLGVPSAEEVEALSKRIDALNDSIDKLAAGRKAKARGLARKASIAAAAH